jgi:hypothetical protein
MGNDKSKIVIKNEAYQDGVGIILKTANKTLPVFVKVGNETNIATDKKLVTINVFIKSGNFEITVDNNTTLEIYKYCVKYVLYNDVITEYFKDLIVENNFEDRSYFGL